MKSEHTSNKRSIDPCTYSVSVSKILVEAEWLFRATVAELPDVAIFEETYEAAYLQVIEVIEALYESSIEEGGQFPEARSITESLGYSGRLTLRMPRWLHAQLGGQADSEKISLNQYLISILSGAGAINALVHEASEKIARNNLAQTSYLKLHGGDRQDVWLPYAAGPNLEAIKAFSFFGQALGVNKIMETKTISPATIHLNDESNYLVEGNC